MCASVASGQATPQEAAREAERRARRYYPLIASSMAAVHPAGPDDCTCRSRKLAAWSANAPIVAGRACSTASRSWSSSACCPPVGLLLVFLTYPLGLGIWLAFTDTTIGRSGQLGRPGKLRVPVRGQAVLAGGVLQRVLHRGRDGRKIRARALARAAAEQPSAVQEHPARHHPACPGSFRRCFRRSRSGGSTTRSSRSSRICFVDVLGLREQLHRLPRLGLAGALVADRRERLARHPVRGDLAARRPADHLAERSTRRR